jgi:hypothetical protein
MAYFAAVGIRFVMFGGGSFWVVSVSLRWAVPWFLLKARDTRASVLLWGVVWLWLGLGAKVAIEIIFTAYMWVEYQPLDFARPHYQIACSKLLVSSDPYGWLDRFVFFPYGSPFRNAPQPANTRQPERQ